jgi:hypothetical protein
VLPCPFFIANCINAHRKYHAAAQAGHRQLKDPFCAGFHSGRDYGHEGITRQKISVTAPLSIVPFFSVKKRSKHIKIINGDNSAKKTHSRARYLLLQA